MDIWCQHGHLTSAWRLTAAWTFKGNFCVYAIGTRPLRGLIVTSTINPIKPNGIPHSYHLDQSISVLRVVGWYFSVWFKFYKNISKQWRPCWTPHSAAPDLGLHCLPMSHKKDAGLIWVKQHWYGVNSDISRSPMSACMCDPHLFGLYKHNVLFVGHRQTVNTQIRHQKTRRLIRVVTVCLQFRAIQ